MNDRVGVPVVRISGFRAGCLDALTLLIGCGVKYLFLLQELCNLHRASPFHAQLENALDYQCRRFIHDPLCLVLRVFTVAEWNIDGQRILDGLQNHPMEYNDKLVRQIIECIVVESKEKIKVVFIGGTEIEMTL